MLRAGGGPRLLRYAALEAAALGIRAALFAGGQEHESSYPALALPPFPHARIPAEPSERVLKTLNRLVRPAVHRSILPGV